VLTCTLSALLLAATPHFGAPRPLGEAPSLDGRILDLALLADGRVLALTSNELARLRIEGLRIRVEARRALPGPLAPVRKPAGLLVLAPETVWVATNQLHRALLVRLGGGLPIESRAERLPWPGAAAGLRHLEGTDLLDGRIAGLPPGPYLDLVPGLGLSPHGRLLDSRGPAAGLRLGPPLCLPWPDLLIASGAAPPSDHDELVAVALLPAPRVLDRVRLPGTVRGLALDVRSHAPRVLVVVGEPPEWLAVPLSREP